MSSSWRKSKCVPISLSFSFSKDIQYCLAIPFFDKQNLFCMYNAKRLLRCWIFENLHLVAWTEKRDFWSCAVHWSKTAPCFLVVNLVGSWFNYFLRSGNQSRGVYTYMLQWPYKTIWINFNSIFTQFFKKLIVKMQNIFNLIGWNSVHIFDIFNCYRANINGMWNARNLGGI